MTNLIFALSFGSILLTPTYLHGISAYVVMTLILIVTHLYLFWGVL
jgi:hypothetical protein